MNALCFGLHYIYIHIPIIQVYINIYMIALWFGLDDTSIIYIVY